MCGPSSAETSTQKSTQDFMTTLQGNYGRLFNEQQGVLTALNNSLNPIVTGGPSQEGFAAPEKAALETRAINTAGAAAQQAEQAARTFGAGEGGGATSGLTSGITKQIESAIASNAAQAEGKQLTDITAADYAQGNQNYWRAVGGEQALGSQYNPSGAMSGANQAGGEAFQEASQITAENNAMGQDIAGFATALAGSAGSILKSFRTPAPASTGG